MMVLQMVKRPSDAVELVLVSMVINHHQFYQYGVLHPRNRQWLSSLQM
jgi:hypothetical protein